MVLAEFSIALFLDFVVSERREMLQISSLYLYLIMCLEPFSYTTIPAGDFSSNKKARTLDILCNLH